MSKEDIERNYNEGLSYLKQAYKDGRQIANGHGRTMDEAITKVAAALQIRIWRDDADSVENGEDVWSHLTATQIDFLMKMVGTEIKHKE